MAGPLLRQYVVHVLPFRTSEYITSFCDKLQREGICLPADLLRCSKVPIEMKLSSNGMFSLTEVGDVLEVRFAVEKKKTWSHCGE